MHIRRRYGTRALVVAALLFAPLTLHAQSPWERAALNLEASFTGPLARSLALVASRAPLAQENTRRRSRVRATPHRARLRNVLSSAR
jgi:hypothetical protein